jgi:hypothetical protein
MRHNIAQRISIPTGMRDIFACIQHQRQQEIPRSLITYRGFRFAWFNILKRIGGQF